LDWEVFVRIIAGSCRGRTILAPKGLDTRPTLDRVKESLFGIIQFQLYGKRVLDLFAGSGSLGLEALSRGASYAVFNDNSREAVKIIKANVEKLGFADKSAVLSLDYKQAVRSAAACGKGFDIVFLDPPYRAGVMEGALNELCIKGVLNSGAMVVAEHDAHIPPVDTGTLELYDRRIYRDTALSFFRREGEV
jgi:16S rRNA (guanine966-N2)-methyltransferase